jgi:protein CpxP
MFLKEEHMTAMQSMKVLVAAAALVATVGAGAAVAQPGWDGGRGHHGRGMREGGVPFAQLNLSDDQRQEIRRIMEQHRTERQAVSNKLREARKAQADAVNTIPVDESAIRARSAELATAETEAALLRARMHSEIYNVLTPDQQAKAKELRAAREQRRQEMRKQRQESRRNRQQRQSPPPPAAAPPQ